MNTFIRLVGALLLVLSTTQTITAVADVGPLTEVSVDGQNILADQNRLTVYVFDRDTLNLSNCYNACAKAWPPVLVAEDTVLDAPLAFTVRKDGEHQLTINGKPLYRYAGDEAPGEINGDGLGGIWHIVPATNEL